MALLACAPVTGISGRFFTAAAPAGGVGFSLKQQDYCTGELGYDGPLYDRFLHMTDDMLGPSPMQYSSYVYDGFCI